MTEVVSRTSVSETQHTSMLKVSRVVARKVCRPVWFSTGTLKPGKWGKHIGSNGASNLFPAVTLMMLLAMYTRRASRIPPIAV